MLLKQDKTEAVLAVDGRLEFIEKEMYVPVLPRDFLTRVSITAADGRFRKRIEKQIADIQGKSDKKRMEVSFRSGQKEASY